MSPKYSTFLGVLKFPRGSSQTLSRFIHFLLVYNTFYFYFSMYFLLNFLYLAIFVLSSATFESPYRWNFGFTSSICIFIGRFGYPTRTCIFFNYVGGLRRKTRSLARKSRTTATFGPVKTLISSARLETPATRRVHY